MPTNIIQSPGVTAPPSFYSALTPPASIDYTSKDWLGFATSMLSYANAAFPQWDTSSEGDFGVMLVELFAYMGDILSFYGDRLTQESYLPTATQRLSILNIATLLGYTPSNGSPATGTVTLQTTSASVAVTIPAGTQIASGYNSSSDQPIIYETDSTVTVPATGGTVTANVTQGVTYTQTILGVSTGTAAQVLQIPQTGVEDGTVTVYVSSSSGTLNQWNQVQFLVDAADDDTSYSLYVDQNQVTNIQFGDNINGLIPGVGLTVYATYTIGLGSAGNQPAGVVGNFVQPVTGVFVPFQSSGSTLYQSSAMTGGSDPETNDQIRANAPSSYSVQQRAVSTDDFEALALNVPGVLMVSAVANHATSVSLYILGPNYLPASAGLESAVSSYFTGKTLAGTSVTLGTASLVLTDVGSPGSHATLAILPNYNQSVVVANVTTALQAVLSPPNATFGMELQLALLYSAIMSVPGVSYVVIPVFTREDVIQTGTNPIQYRPYEIPSPGTFYFNVQGGIVT